MTGSIVTSHALDPANKSCTASIPDSPAFSSPSARNSVGFTHDLAGTHPDESSRGNLDFSDDIHPSRVEQDDFLNVFRVEFLPSFPFVIVEETDPRDLRMKRPHVWRSVMFLGAWKQPARQSKMAQEVLQSYNDRLLQYPVKTLDLLQGMMITTAW